MKFFTNHPDFHTRIRDHDVYKPVEVEDAAHADMIAAFIKRDLRPVDSGYDQTFQIRFADGACYTVDYYVLASFTPEWEILDTVKITEIPLAESKIAEAPGAFVTAKIAVEDIRNLPVPNDGTVLGAYLLSPPREHGAATYRNSTGCLPLAQTASGEPAMRLHVVTFNSTLTIPLAVLRENGCDIEILVKFPTPDSPDDTPTP